MEPGRAKNDRGAVDPAAIFLAPSLTSPRRRADPPALASGSTFAPAAWQAPQRPRRPWPRLLPAPAGAARENISYRRPQGCRYARYARYARCALSSTRMHARAGQLLFSESHRAVSVVMAGWREPSSAGARPSQQRPWLGPPAQRTRRRFRNRTAQAPNPQRGSTPTTGSAMDVSTTSGR